jgi:NAD(P)-dependent dehydrogenase (short-subunit alcohol dehydrogenase family)
MELKNTVAVITGGASGIGLGLAERFYAEGASHVAIADLNGDLVASEAARIGASGHVVDVCDEDAIKDMVRTVQAEHGPIDVFASNAGYVTIGGLEAPNEEITDMFDVHVMSHVYAARAVLPSMIEQGGGYLLNTASAAGLLTQIGSLAYAVTKHAAVALAEWLAVTHGDQGIKVSVLCPQAVATNIGQNSPTRDRDVGSIGVASADGVLTTVELADVVIEAMSEERFWVLPHPEVETYARRKADDVDRWLAGMRRFQSRLYAGGPGPGDWLTQ